MFLRLIDLASEETIDKATITVDSDSNADSQPWPCRAAAKHRH